MQRLDVRCPSAPWENTTTDEDRAWDLCFSLSEDYGYACVYERVNGTIIGEYTDGRATWGTGTLGAQDAPLTPYDLRVPNQPTQTNVFYHSHRS